MYSRCEASGLRVRRNADGRATCPLCGDDWHCLGKDGRMRPHQRTKRELTDDEIAALLKPHLAVRWCPGEHNWIASADIKREVCALCPTWRWKGEQPP